MTPRVDIIIPTWNGLTLLKECLASLTEQTFQSFEVTVVDDGSTDGTADRLQDEFPDVRVVRLDENRGFCAAVNAGIAATSLDQVLLLNNDMTLDAHCIERLVAVLDNDDADMVAPLVYFRDEPDVVYSAGDRMRKSGRSECFGHCTPRDEFRAPDWVFGVSAGAALYRRVVFDRVGVLDERYGAYFEDADLSFRARLAGYRAAFAADAVAYHVGSASISGQMWYRSRQCCRNHALLVIKNMPSRLILRHAPRIARERVHQMARLVSGARTEFGLARALGMLVAAEASVCGMLPQLMRDRFAIQRARRVSDAELEAMLIP